MGLRNIAQGQRPCATVTLRGVPVVVRDLTGAEAAALSTILPPAIAPLGPDPRKGSLAPPVPRTDDPKFVAATRTRHLRLRCAEIAIATEWTDDQGRTFAQTPEADRSAWCDAARRWCEAELTNGEILALDEALARLSTGPGGTQEEPGKG